MNAAILKKPTTPSTQLNTQADPTQQQNENDSGEDSMQSPEGAGLSGEGAESLITHLREMERQRAKKAKH